MQDFAKLFQIDGIGQVLVTLECPSEGDSCDDDAGVIRLRIPDGRDVQFQMAMFLSDEVEARKVFDGMTAERAIRAIKPLLAARANLIADA